MLSGIVGSGLVRPGAVVDPITALLTLFGLTPVSWKKLDEATGTVAVDSANSLLNGTYSNAVEPGAAIRQGAAGAAMFTAGDADRVDSPVITTLSTQMTVLLYCRFPTVSTLGLTTVLAQNDFTNSWSMLVDEGRVLRFRPPGAAQEAYGATTLLADTTYCLAASFNAVSADLLYVNGVQDGGGESVAPLGVAVSGNVIASRGGDLYTTSRMSDVMVFDTVLSFSQIAAFSALRI